MLYRGTKTAALSTNRRRCWFNSFVGRTHFTLFILASFVFSMATIAINFLRIFLEPSSIRRNNHFSKKYGTISTPGGESVYVPGAGFSGYFYTLGRLQATTSSHQNDGRICEYYCFSAGCLALVTAMMQLPVERALDIAHTSRNRWINGDFGRYDVVGYFVDELVFSEESQEPGLSTIVDRKEYFGQECNSFNETQSPDVGFVCLQNISTRQQSSSHKLLHKLRQINIITTEWTSPLSYSLNVHKPGSIDHLKELLIRTTWIPMVTGSSFGKTDLTNGRLYNDGAFAGLIKAVDIFNFGSYGVDMYSRHDHSLLLPWNCDLLLNTLNIFLDSKQAIKFWNYGRLRGMT